MDAVVSELPRLAEERGRRFDETNSKHTTESKMEFYAAAPWLTLVLCVLATLFLAISTSGRVAGKLFPTIAVSDGFMCFCCLFSG